MILYLKQFIVDNWESLGVDDKIPRNLSFIKLCYNNYEFGRLVFLWFKENERKPFLVSKVCRNRKYSEVLTSEFENLSAIYNSLPPSLQKTIPRPIALEYINGDLVLMETFLSGIPIQVSFRKKGVILLRKTVAEQLHIVVSWLEDFYKAANNPEKVLSNNWFNTLIKTPIDQFCTVFWDISNQTKDFLLNYQDEIQGLTALDIPLVPCHGDFAPTNILFNKKKITGIIDWEYCQIAGLPFLDLFNFMTRLISSSFLIYPTKERKVKMFKKMYFNDNWLSSLVKETTLEYCQVINLPFEVSKKFFPIFLIRTAMMQYNLYGKLFDNILLFKEFVELFVSNQNRFCLNKR